MNDAQIKLDGDVHILKSIPFDYREQHPDLFTKEAMKSMMDKAIGQSNQNSIPTGSSNEMTGGTGTLNISLKGTKYLKKNT